MLQPFQTIMQLAPENLTNPLSHASSGLSRQEIAEAMQQMSAWTRLAFKDGIARIESEPNAAVTQIRLTDRIEEQITMGVLFERAFIAFSRQGMRWLFRLPWRGIFLPPPNARPHDATCFRLELDELTMSKISGGKRLPGMHLYFPVGEKMLRTLREHGAIDVRMHHPQTQGVSTEVFTRIPVFISSGFVPDPYPRGHSS